MANIDHTQSVLLTATELLRENYLEQVDKINFQHGSSTMRLFKPAEKIAKEDGITHQVIEGITDSARASRDASADFKNPRPMQARKLKVRFSWDNAAANDFTELSASAEIPDIELAGDPLSAAVNVAQETQRQLSQNVDFSWPLLFHAPASGRMGLINGTAKAGDSLDYSGASSYSSGATSARVQIDGGSIAPFQENTRWDAYSAAGVLLGDELRISHTNTPDNSVEFETTSDTTVADLDLLADDAELFRSGERNQGMVSSLKAWLSVPSSGESFVGGVDRTTSNYKWLNPVVSRNGSSVETIDQTHLDDFGKYMSYRSSENMTPVILGSTALFQSLRTSFSNNALIHDQPQNRGEYTIGEIGLAFQHPKFGKVTLVGDELAPDDELKFIVAQDWSLYSYGFSGLRIMPGNMGNWFVKNGSNPGARSKYLRMEAYMYKALLCRFAKRQGVILNLQP